MDSPRMASPVGRPAPLQVDSDDMTESDAEWTTLPTTEFDEIVASIIVNPDAGILALKSPLIQRERDGSTLLHLFAGGENCEELIVYLIGARIPVNMPDNSGWTPLLEAAQEGQIRNCEVLLAHGAIPYLAATGGITPLRAAVKVGNVEMTKWLLKQPDTWSRKWDDAFFALLLQKTPAAALDYLDFFAQVQSHSKLGNAAVMYTGLAQIYGDPSVPVEQTALALAASAPNGKQVLPHRVMRHLMKAKWQSFAKVMFRRELSIYCLLVASYYVPIVFADPNWVHLASMFDYCVAFCRALSWICSLHLLLRVEYLEYVGSNASVASYFQSFWNILNFTSYVTTIVTIPFEFIESLAEVLNCLHALVTVTLWVNLLQFLQVTPHSGLLLAMMSRMRNDVARFFLLYSVFLLGFSGAFYLLLRGGTGFETFQNSFLTVFLMLFGHLDYETFSATDGWTWQMCHGLLFAYLLSVVVVLLNILIAMMATTYSAIWDAAEAETMLCHAQAIIRMEKSLSRATRAAKFRELLGHKEAQAAQENGSPHLGSSGNDDDASTKVPIQPLERQTSTQGLRAHFSAKRAMVASIVAKMKAMPTKVGTALANSPTGKSVKSMMAQHTPKFTAPNLDALRESLFLKSTFDEAAGVNGDCGDGDSGTHRELGLLEDGIRYEAPLRSLNEPKTQDELLLELQTQLQQLMVQVKDLSTGTAHGGNGAGTNVAAVPRRRKSLVRYASEPSAEFV